MKKLKKPMINVKRKKNKYINDNFYLINILNYLMNR